MTPEQYRQFIGTLYGGEEKNESSFIPLPAKFSPYTMYSNAMLYFDKEGTYGKIEIRENKKDTVGPSLVATVEERYGDALRQGLPGITGYVIHTEDKKVIDAAKKILGKIEEPQVNMVFTDMETKKNPKMAKMKETVEAFCREHGIRPEAVQNEFGKNIGVSYQLSNLQREEIMRYTLVEPGVREKPKAKH